MKCTKCGNEITNREDNFCAVCGTKVVKELEVSEKVDVPVAKTSSIVIKKKNIIICCIVVIAMVLVYKYVNSKPSLSQISRDIRQNHQKYVVYQYDGRITDVDIEKYKIDEDEAKFWCTVTIDSGDEEIQRTVEVEYEYYEKAGWEYVDSSLH